MQFRSIEQKALAFLLAGILSTMLFSINAIANQISSIPNTWNDILDAKERRYEIYHAYSDVVYAAWSQVFNDYPELSEEVLAEMVQYSLYDLDDDGIAELFVNVATSEASAYIDVYSYNNGLIHLGRLSGLYSSIWNDGENTVRWEQVGDHRAIYSISILNKKIVEKKVYEDLNEDTVPEGYANYANSSYSGSDTYGLDSIVGTFLCYEEMDYNNHIYRIYSSVLSPENADAFCESNNGHLVSIASSKENDAITSYINGKNSLTTVGWYTGLHFTENNSGFQYEWLDGTDYNYSNWEEGYDGFLEAHASERNDIYGVLLSSGKWHSSLWSWGDFQSFICEWDSKEEYQSWQQNNKDQDDVIDNPSTSDDISLYVTPTSLSLNVDETKKITAMYAPPLEDGKNIEWSSSDESVVAVTNDGVVKGVGRGTALVTVTYPGTSASSTCQIEVLDKPIDNPFNPQNNAWGYVNGHEGFGYETDYAIPLERYEKVFGKKYIAAATTGYNPDTKKTTFNSMIEEEWGGNCYGMSATSILFYLNQLKWADYDKLYDNDFSLLNNYFTTHKGNMLKGDTYSVSDKETPVTELVESYQILNYGVGLQKLNGNYVVKNTSIQDIDDYISFDETEEGALQVKENGKIIEKKGTMAAHLAEGNYIANVLSRIQNAKVPLLMNIFYMSDGSVAGHTMVTRTDVSPKQMNDGWWRVYLYDPNHPWFPSTLKMEGYRGRNYYVQDEKDACFIELNPNENKWRYYGSENNATSDEYHGTDKAGNVKYLVNTWTSDDGKADAIDFSPEYLFILDISKGVMPTSFNGKDAYWDGADGKTKSSTSIYVAPYSSFELYDVDGTLLCTASDGNVSVKKRCLFSPKASESLTAEANGGGIITVSTHNLVAKNVSGNDITFIDGDSAISIAPNDSVVTASLEMDNNHVSLKCDKSGTVTSQITDLSDKGDETSSVSEQAKLNNGSQIDFKLRDNRLTAESDVQGNDSVNYYVRTRNSQFAQLVKTVDSNSKKSFEIKDIRGVDQGVIKGSDGKWALYKEGKVDTSYTGIAKNQYGWWRIEKGYVNFNATGIYNNEYGWWRVENGKVNFNANGIYKNQYGWWKTTGGKVTFKETGVFKNEYGWWRVENSKVNFKAKGIYKNPYGWWKTNDGKVTFKENGVFKNEYGWWKVKDSKVDFSFTGIASNKYGKWYIKDGKVDFSKNGKVNYNGATYSIKNGKVQ